MDTVDSLDAALAELASSLPRDAGFEWEATEDGLYVAMLSIPVASRGIGTVFLSRVLEEADRRGVPVSLDADATGSPADPTAFNLSRWYRRFGFALTGLTSQGWLSMHRVPRPWRGVGAIARDYEAIKRYHDLTEDAYAEALEGFEIEGDREPAPRIALTP